MLLSDWKGTRRELRLADARMRCVLAESGSHVDSSVGHYTVVTLSACKLGLAAFSCLVRPTQRNPFVALSLTTPDVWMDRCTGDDESPVDELIHVADLEGDEEETRVVMFRMDLMYYRGALSPPIVNNRRGGS